MEEIFRCKFANKKGFENCRMQCKVVFPDSVQLFLTSDSHEHGRKTVITYKFTQRSNPDAEEIVKLGVEHNDLFFSINETKTPI